MDVHKDVYTLCFSHHADVFLSNSSDTMDMKSIIYVGCQDSVLYALNLDNVTSELEPSVMPGTTFYKQIKDHYDHTLE